MLGANGYRVVADLKRHFSVWDLFDGESDRYPPVILPRCQGILELLHPGRPSARLRPPHRQAICLFSSSSLAGPRPVLAILLTCALPSKGVGILSRLANMVSGSGPFLVICNSGIYFNPLQFGRCLPAGCVFFVCCLFPD